MSNPTTASIKDQNKNEASSMFKRNVRKFMNNKLALFGLIVVVLITIACIVGFIMGVDYNTPMLPNMKNRPAEPISSARTPSAGICSPECWWAAAIPS